jgi:hypothetical protein
MGSSANVLPREGFQEFLGDPEGYLDGPPGLLARDPLGPALYMKESPEGSRIRWYSFKDSHFPVVSVWRYGAKGQGEDYTTKFQQAIDTADAKTVIMVPPGQYVIDALIQNKDVSWEIHPGAEIIHKGNASGNLLTMTAPCTGFFRGGTINGNKEEFSAYPQRRYALISAYGDGLRIEGVRFKNYMLAAIQDGLTKTVLRILDCDFRDGAEHGGTYNASNPQYSTCINVFRSDASTQDTTPLIVVDGCYMGQAEDNIAQGAAPGGVIVAGSNALNCYVRLQVTNSVFERLGQSCPTVGNAHHIGSVDAYSAIKNVIVSGNFFINNRYQPVKLTNASRVIVTDNIVIGCEESSTAGLGLVDYQASLRDGETDQHELIIIRGNVLLDGGDSVCGIRISCSNGFKSRKIQIEGNHIDGCGRAIRLVNCEGHLVLADNVGYAENGGGSAGALEFQNFTGRAHITGNFFEAIAGVHALYATSGNTGEFYFSGNHFKASAVGIYAAVVTGGSGFAIAKFHAADGTWEGTTTATLIAGSGEISELWFSPDNVVVGSHTITFANVTEVIRSIAYDANPEGLVKAGENVEFIRTTTGAHAVYRKMFNTPGSENLGWRFASSDAFQFIASADYTAKLSDSCLAVSTAIAARIITLPAAADAVGKMYRIFKSDSSVGTVTITPVAGGDVVLSNQYDAKIVVSTGLLWAPMNLV